MGIQRKNNQTAQTVGKVSDQVWFYFCIGLADRMEQIF